MTKSIAVPTGPRLLHKHHAPIRNVAWLPDSFHLFSADDHGMLILSRVPDGEPLGLNQCHPTSISALKAARLEPLVATAAVDGVVRIWKYEVTPDERLVIELIAEAQFEGEVAGIDFRPGEDTALGIADSSGTVSLWCPLQGSKPSTIATLPAQANSTAWSPDGRLLAVGCDDFAVHLLDLEGGPEKIFRGHKHHADQLGYSRCGRYLASGSHDRTVRVWDVASGVEIAVLPHDLDTVKPDWAVDGRLATCSYDRKIRIWDPIGGCLLRTLTGHTYDIDDLAWSPDGRYLASCGWDNRVIVYDGDTYGAVTRMEGGTHRMARSCLPAQPPAASSAFAVRNRATRESASCCRPTKA
jgi:WD40 repeat protein